MWHVLTCNRQIFRALYSSTHTLIHYVKGEELALSSRITPGADIGLAGDSGSDSPPRDINRVDAYSTYKKQDNKMYIHNMLQVLSANKNIPLNTLNFKTPWLKFTLKCLMSDLLMQK